MNRATRIIKGAEKAAKQYQESLGCDDSTRLMFQVGWLQHELASVCAESEASSNPPGCTEVESDGVRYGLKWNKDGEFWEIFIGGQCVNVALSGGLIDELCDKAERIALDGEAA